LPELRADQAEVSETAALHDSIPVTAIEVSTKLAAPRLPLPMGIPPRGELVDEAAMIDRPAVRRQPVESSEQVELLTVEAFRCVVSQALRAVDGEL
jgi:hypothetical protein